MTETRNNKSKKKKLSLFGKTFIYFIILVLTLTTGTILLNKSFVTNKEKVVKYNENSKVDYKVYLKKNDFYEQEYLGKDMLYVATLIDKIGIDFNYTFNSEVNQNLDFTYSIVANLTISNPTGTKSYFEKSYTLLEEKKVSLKDSNNQMITEKINIDYPYYNNLANSFKTQYGVDAESKLTIYMLINKTSSEDNTLVLGSSSTMNVSVPLSERAVDIRLDYKEINETSQIIEKEKITIKDFLPLILGVILVVVSLVIVIKLIRTINKMIRKKSAYEKYINKILREYDRLIAESSTLLSFEDKEIINISKFTELLDIHDNLQLPIMYYEIEPYTSCVFYISHENVIYLLEISADNLEK